MSEFGGLSKHPNSPGSMHLKRRIVENAEDGHDTVVEEEGGEARTQVSLTESVNVKYRPHASTDEREYRPDTGSPLLLFILTWV